SGGVAPRSARRRQPPFVKETKIVFWCGVVGLGTEVEELGCGPAADRSESEARRELADDGARRFLAAVSADEAERAFANRRIEGRAIEQLRVVVAVTPGVGAGCAGRGQSIENLLVVTRAFLLGGEVLRPRPSEKFIGDGAAGPAGGRRADAELVHQRRSAAGR